MHKHTVEILIEQLKTKWPLINNIPAVQAYKGKSHTIFLAMASTDWRVPRQQLMTRKEKLIM